MVALGGEARVRGPDEGPDEVGVGGVVEDHRPRERRCRQRAVLRVGGRPAQRDGLAVAEERLVRRAVDRRRGRAVEHLDVDARRVGVAVRVLDRHGRVVGARVRVVVGRRDSGAGSRVAGIAEVPVIGQRLPVGIGRAGGAERHVERLAARDRAGGGDRVRGARARRVDDLLQRAACRAPRCRSRGTRCSSRA